MKDFRGFCATTVVLVEIMLSSLLLSGCVHKGRLVTDNSLEDDRYEKIYDHLLSDNSIRDFFGLVVGNFHVKISEKTEFIRYSDFHEIVAQARGFHDDKERGIRDSLLQIDKVRLKSHESIYIPKKMLNCCSYKDSRLILIFHLRTRIQ